MGFLSVQRLCMVGGALELVVLVLSLMQRGAYAQGNNCSTSTLMPLSPCLPYILAGNTSVPGSDCCDPLKSLFATDPTCLCQLAPFARQAGLSVNETRALDIASLCQQTVPASVVSCLSSQITAPVGAPLTSPPTSSSGFSPPAQTGNDSSLGSNLSSPLLLLIIGSFFVALFLHLGGISS